LLDGTIRQTSNGVTETLPKEPAKIEKSAHNTSEPAKIIGTWNRITDDYSYTLTATPQQITFKGWFNDKPESIGVITADYKQIDDGSLVGVFTSTKAQELVEQPFCCRFKVRDGELIVTSFNLGVGASSLKICQELEKMCVGRYSAGEMKPASKEGRQK
jgi:hypothetical protein